MGKIHVLDLSVANLIAAGEVVERPSSAIKEMVENSIDAGATAITVEIAKGGIALMRVTDNGSGMSGEDAVLAVRRHATSKIEKAEDLFSIMTLGFRGEALAAITAVSEYRIMTKQRKEPGGTLLSGAYGTVSEIEEIGCPDGTTILCERLFATTPARLKFLKSDSAEGAAVAQTMERLAVSRPEIAFKFISDGNLKFSTSGDGNLQNAIYSVYGGVFAGKLLEIHYVSSGIGVDGFVSAPENVRGNRSMQHFFINSRSVRSKTMTAALEAAFRSYIPSDKFPSCVLNIRLAAALVDVNIHPAKLEVKFSNEKAVFDAIYAAVKGTLESKIRRPEWKLEKKTAEIQKELHALSAFVPQERPKPELSDLFERAAEKGRAAESSPLSAKENDQMTAAVSSEEAAKKPLLQDDDIDIDVPPLRDIPLHSPSFQRVGAETDFAAFERRSTCYHPVTGTKEEYDAPLFPDSKKPTIPESTDACIAGAEKREIPEYRLIGEAFAGYILMETGEKLMIIDKHAAHERINFERLRAGMRSQHPNVQLLMAPEKLPVSAEEAEICRVYRTELEGIGFEFDLTEREVLIRGIPQDFALSEAKDLFVELITRSLESGESVESGSRSYFERALYQSSCKAAIKIGRVYDEEHIRWICDNILRYDCIKFCPHGRPVAFEISKKELELRFGRT